MNENNTIVGDNVFLGQQVSGALVFGDECRAEVSGAVVVGKTLFGVKIPKAVRRFVLRNPTAASWMIRAVAWGTQATLARRSETEGDSHVAEIVDGDGEGV